MKRLIYLVCLPVLFYPVYFTAANFIDTLFGGQQLINWLTFDSRSILLKTFVRDWLASFPVMYAILFLLILPVEFFSKKITEAPVLVIVLSMIIMAIISYAAGFGEAAIIINTTAVFFMVAIYYFSKTIVFQKLK